MWLLLTTVVLRDWAHQRQLDLCLHNLQLMQLLLGMLSRSASVRPRIATKSLCMGLGAPQVDPCRWLYFATHSAPVWLLQQGFERCCLPYRPDQQPSQGRPHHRKCSSPCCASRPCQSASRSCHRSFTRQLQSHGAASGSFHRADRQQSSGTGRQQAGRQAWLHRDAPKAQAAQLRVAPPRCPVHLPLGCSPPRG